ncbi:hypothetical protein J6TS7_00450 [Paenibacillus dendritiformis]|nr:hypothetical protein J6TS7_00450 [Paenibacillus dendritiformis]
MRKPDAGRRNGGARRHGQRGEKVKIGVTQVVNHASLDEAYKGFVQALKDNGYTEGDNLVID